MLINASRRDFLKILTCLASCNFGGAFAADGSEKKRALEKETTGASYRVKPWTGDDFTLGHQLRDGKLPKFPDKADAKTDFVIVGGGMAGLACGYFLKNHDFLLLEQYANTGGTSSGGTYKGIDYSIGAVCTGSNDGEIGRLFEELSIKPVLIAPEETAWHCNGQWYHAITGNDRFHSELNRLLHDIEKVTKDQSATAFRSNSLVDQTKFSQYLSSYDRGFLGLINNTCNSFFCAPPEEVSAAAGFFMVKALTTNSYVFNGGNSAVSKALRLAIDKAGTDRVRASSFVWRVAPSPEGGVSVMYSDSDGARHRVDCKHVVIATPPLVAMRIAPALPQSMKEIFSKLEYSAFMVANFCMPKKVLQSPYQSFADEPYPFGQMVMAEAPYIAANKYKPEMGSVLTIYHPFSHGPSGRAKLLAANKEQLAEALIPQLCKLLEPIDKQVEEVVFTRWGHSGIVPRPGVSSTLHQIKQESNWMTFAHSTASGGASLEGAIASGRMAANRCLGL